jgi:hypothetical protein
LGSAQANKSNHFPDFFRQPSGTLQKFLDIGLLYIAETDDDGN